MGVSGFNNLLSHEAMVTVVHRVSRKMCTFVHTPLLSVLLLSLCAGNLFAIGSDPVWQVAESTRRVVIDPVISSGRIVMVPLPDGVFSLRALSEKGAAVPVRVFPGEGGFSAAMVDLSAVYSQRVSLYLDVKNATLAESAKSPVYALIRKAAGKDLPATRGGFRYLMARAGEVVKRTSVVSFDLSGVSSASRYRSRRSYFTRSGFLVEMRSWVYRPTGGKVRFALKGYEAACLRVDGEIVAERYKTGTAVTSWSIGRELDLDAGVHDLEIYTAGRHISGQIGISVAGADPVAIAGDDLVCGARMLKGRLEHSGEVVHAAMKIDPGNPYRFGDDGVTFLPLHLSDRSVNWLGDPMSRAWHLDGVVCGGDAEMDTVVQVERARELTLAVESFLGFNAITSDRVMPPLKAAKMYDVSGCLSGVPAVCYDYDQAWPCVDVRAKVPEGMIFNLSADVKMLDGRTVRNSADVAIEVSWGRLALPLVTAGDVDSIDWRIAHAGVGIVSGSVDFVRAPLAELPTGVRGDMLQAAGDAREMVVVLEPYVELSKLSQSYKGVFPVALLDASLGTAAHFDMDESHRFDSELSGLLQCDDGDVTFVDASWIYNEDQSHPSLGRISELSRRFANYPGVAVISLGGEAILNNQPPDLFERELAALCGLLSGPGNVDLLLVTPPPYEGYEEAVRDLAEAVQRVADARGYIVADVYTACRTLGDGAGVVDGLRITDRGATLAARVIARSLSKIIEGVSDE